MTRIPRRAVVLVAGVLVAIASAAAHEGHGGHGSSGLGTLPSLTFLLSLAVVSIAVYLNHRGAVDGRWADVGVLLGVLGVIASIVLLV